MVEYNVEYQRVLTTMCLLSAVEDSNYTKEHSLRVGRIIKGMLDLVDYYTDEQKQIIIRSAYFHDVGKIKLPRRVLFKAGKLNEEEYDIIKTHSQYGYEILNDLDLPREADIVLQHHERLDGSGYPNGYKNLRFESQIIAVVDVFDAITTDRPYRKGLCIKDALIYLYSVSVEQFNLDCIKLLHKYLVKMKKIKKQLDK